MLRSLATTGLVVEASRKIHETVGVLSIPKVGVLQAGGGADGAIDGLLEDQRRQFEFQVSYGVFWVGEADQLLGDVDWLLDVPGVVLDVSVWVYLVLPGTQTQSFGVSEVR